MTVYGDVCFASKYVFETDIFFAALCASWYQSRSIVLSLELFVFLIINPFIDHLMSQSCPAVKERTREQVINLSMTVFPNNFM